MARSRVKNANDTKELKKTVTGIDKVKAEVEEEFKSPHIFKKLSELTPVSLVSTGIFTLDLALLGGLVESTFDMYSGQKGTGKTSNSLLCAKQSLIKHPDEKLVFVDVEQHLDKDWAEGILGQYSDRVEVIEDAGVAEAFIDILEDVILTGEVGFVIFDSIAALIPEDRAEKSAFDAEKMAQLAKVVGRLISLVSHARMELRKRQIRPPTFLFINQFISSMAQYGSPFKLVGGEKQHQVVRTHVQFNPAKHLTVGKNDWKYADYKIGTPTPLIANESMFEIKKEKSGSYKRDGSYIFTRSDAHPRLMAGELDEFEVVVKTAKQFGFVGGAGLKQRISCYPDEIFPNMVAMALRLMEDPTTYLILKAAIVAKVREMVGKSTLPYDNNLMNAPKKQLLDLLKATSEGINSKTGNTKT